jgi:signal transduction histidine kinase
MPSGDFHVQTHIGTLGWLDVNASEGQAGMHSEPRVLVLDYLLRIYLIRFVAIVLIALVAVRFAVRPLKQLANAAEALGTDIYRPPLTIAGPREVRTAAQSFNAMQRQLVESIGARTRMLANISHDLRSPLTRLRLRTEMLTDEQARERLRGDLEEMETMIRSTLDFVQGIDIAEPRHDVDIDSMLQGLRDDALEAGADVQLSGHARGPVAGFPRNLKRCLQNLLDNAIRHGGSARVSTDDDGRKLTIVVSDNGPGLDDALLERVFEPYFRAPAAGKVPVAGGTGLGLTIARSIATAHGGALILRNRAGGGLDAMLVLPRAVPQGH